MDLITEDFDNPFKYQFSNSVDLAGTVEVVSTEKGTLILHVAGLKVTVLTKCQSAFQQMLNMTMHPYKEGFQPL